jgi:hypothetical protein
MDNTMRQLNRGRTFVIVMSTLALALFSMRLLAAESPQTDALHLFEAALPQLRSVHPDQYDTPEKLESAWKRFQETLALSQTARKKGLADTPEMRYRIAQLLAQEIITRDAETARPMHSVPDAEVRQYFETNKANYDLPVTLGAHEIVLKFDPSEPAQRDAQRARASGIVTTLGTGLVDLATFVACARTNSDAESFQSNGGHLGIFPARPTNNRIPPLPENAVEALLALKTVGRITGPIESRKEIRILRLSAYRDAVPARFESVKESIRYALYLSAREQRIKELTAESGFDLDGKLDAQTIQRLLPSRIANAGKGPDLPPSPDSLGIPAPEAIPKPTGTQSP